MKIKKYFNFENLIIFLTLLALFFLLCWRFRVGMVRFLDEDEFTHMFATSMIVLGKVPYKDFGYFFSPILAFLLSPLFFFFKDNVAVVFLARSGQFFIFLLTVFVVGCIVRRISGPRTGVLAAFLCAFLPLALDKTVEVRPDSLAILFWLVSLLFLLSTQKNSSNEKFLIFLSGGAFGLSLVAIIKTVFAYPGLVFYLIWISRSSLKKLCKNLLSFHLGIIIPLALLLFFLAFLGVFSQAIYEIFIIRTEIVSAYGKKYFIPFFPFYPNDAFYGLAGKSLPWFLSNSILLLGIAGLFKSRLRIFLLSSFVCFLFALFFVYRMTNVQYYLPILYLSLIGAAELLGFVGGWLEKKSRILFSLYWILLLFVLSLGYWQSVKAHLNWTNDYQVKSIKNILTVSRPTDHFYDVKGVHLFRPSGYYICCELYPDFISFLSKPLPRLEDDFRKNQTKFLFKTKRIALWPPEDKDGQFLKENYFPSGVEDILVVGKKITFLNDSPVEFELLADGDYILEKDGQGIVLIDGKQINSDYLFLTHGNHLARGVGLKGIFLRYNIKEI